MKTKIHKISSFFLALLVLLSTFSVTIEKHFCGDSLVDISYFGYSEGCATIGEEDCDNPEVIAVDNCCKDEVEYIDGQEELKTTSEEKFNVKQQHFLLAFTVSYLNLFQGFSEKRLVNSNYLPPQITLDLQVLHEVFII